MITCASDLRGTASYNGFCARNTQRLVGAVSNNMADSFGKLVVRSYAPKRRAMLWTLAGLLIAGILYASFELGRYDAGFRVVDSVRGALSASRRIRSLEAENRRQREQLEAADVARRVDREGY